jgi:hypothetical protein
MKHCRKKSVITHSVRSPVQLYSIIQESDDTEKHQVYVRYAESQKVDTRASIVRSLAEQKTVNYIGLSKNSEPSMLKTKLVTEQDTVMSEPMLKVLTQNSSVSSTIIALRDMKSIISYLSAKAAYITKTTYNI